MAIEVTWARRHRLHPSHVEQLGGPGWSADPATVIGEIDEGREYFVRQGDVLLRVAVIARNGRSALTTDRSDSAENALLLLPSSSE
jgi:hypothetical protein